MSADQILTTDEPKRRTTLFCGKPHWYIDIEYATMNILLVWATASILMDRELHLAIESNRIRLEQTFLNDNCLDRLSTSEMPAQVQLASRLVNEWIIIS